MKYPKAIETYTTKPGKCSPNSSCSFPFQEKICKKIDAQFFRHTSFLSSAWKESFQEKSKNNSCQHQQ